MADAAPSWQTPTDPAAPSALVSATHLLEFELQSLETRAEERDPVRGLSRDIILYVEVTRVFKADGFVPALGRAGLRLRQTGLDPLAMGPPPTLDPETLEIGARYLLDTVAPEAASLNVLFAAARGVYPGGFLADAALAADVETAGTADDAAALLAMTQARRGAVQDLWGDYLLYHYRDEMLSAPRQAIAALARVALDPGTDPRLAITLLSEVDAQMLDHSGDADLTARLGLAYLYALPRIPSPQVRAYVAGRNVHGRVYEAALGDGYFGADAETRAAAHAALADAADARALAVRRWLEPG